MSAQSRTTQAAQSADKVAHKGSEALQGKVPDSDIAMGHPLHPGTVHWPIAFLSASFGITSLNFLPASIYPTSILPGPAALSSLAYYSAAAGTLTAIPALITGVGEAYELIRKDYKERGSSWKAMLDAAWTQKDTGGQKVKMTITHASMNDLVVGLAAYNWYRGYKYPGQALPRGLLVANAVAFPLLFYSAMLGGKLVYEYAVGIQRQGQGAAIKEKMQKGE